MNLNNPTGFMQRALALAQQGAGYTSPNPMVGAVIVRDNRIVAEGFHACAGGPHAEIAAIENAREPVFGATMYCTLEPCSHNTPSKRTPPCVEKLISAGLAKVVVATLDPNPLVSGNGVRLLQDAGIEVSVGLLARQATLLNGPFFKFIQTGKPFVHLKMATSLDGRIATSNLDSKWITDGDARSKVQQMRHQFDAVLVGLNTVVADNPRLTVREFDGRQPWRIVTDSSLKIPSTVNLLSDAHRARTIVVTTKNHNGDRRRQLEQQGITVLVAEAGPTGRVVLADMLDQLAEHKITSMLVEGGSHIHTSFIKNKLFDKISSFIAPIIIGEGLSAIGDLGSVAINQALRLQLIEQTIINDQVLISGYRDPSATFGILADNLKRNETCLQDSLKPLVL